ncbi:hypothetical protein FRC17_001945 [Serendipita sp. 399]|nr:hypothetical protein FRC17_001945 [Serendipita sp. 399]
MSIPARPLAFVAKPRKSSSILPINTPFSLSTLQRISSAIIDHNAATGFDLAAFLTKNTSAVNAGSSSQSQAAVLLPLANIDDKPSILFQVRANLRTHSGEVSFPGGKKDDDDIDLEHTAKRETHEEIGTTSSRIQILSPFGPVEKSLGGSTVYPYVGFISGTDVGPLDVQRNLTSFNDTIPLPNLDLSQLSINKAEVAMLFHLSIAELLDEGRLNAQQFRGHPPYWCVNVSDKVPEEYWTTPQELVSQTHSEDSAAGHRKTLQIWGLTACSVLLNFHALGT